MKTRMDKYQTEEVRSSRREKNRKLYDEVSDMNIDYVDINVDNVIDFSKTQKVGTRESYKKQKELNYILPVEKNKRVFEEKSEETKEERVYDINEILKLARQNKLFEESDSKKRMINTEYNILTKLDLEEVESSEYSKENLHDLINTIYEKEKTNTKEEKKLAEEVKEEKKNLEKDDLFEDLKEEIDLDEETSKEILDKEEKDTKKEEKVLKDLEDTLEAEQDDEEDDDEDEDTDTIEIDDATSNKIAFIIVFVFILLGIVAYLVLNYFKII